MPFLRKISSRVGAVVAFRCDESSLLGGACALPTQLIQGCHKGANAIRGPSNRNTPPALRYNAVSLKMVTWVARVSRLIGKTDSTAKSSYWQVYFCSVSNCKWLRADCNEPADGRNAAQKRNATQKRHSEGSGVSVSCTGHWPPKSMRGGGCVYNPSHLLQVFPAGFPHLWGRYFGGGSCRILLFLLLPGIFPAAVHHWHPLYSNSLAVPISFYFQRVANIELGGFSAFWNPK